MYVNMYYIKQSFFLECAECAQTVYGLQVPPIPTIDRRPVNVSLCALKTRKLINGGKRVTKLKEFPHMIAVGSEGNNENILWRYLDFR